MSSNDAKGASKGILSINTSAGVTDAWLKMQEQTLMMNKAMMPDVSKLFPDMSKFAAPILTDSTLQRMAELSQKMADVAAANFATKDLERIRKMIDQASGLDSAAKRFSENNAALGNEIYKSLNSFKVPTAFYDERFQKSIAAATSSLVNTIDTSRIQDILATASAFRDEFAEQDLDEIADEFFDNHPDLAESIEEDPKLFVLSKEDRNLIIWFVRIMVTLYVVNALLHLGTENPDLKDMLDAFGFLGGSGAGAGYVAGEATKKVLDRLPQEEAE